jgi:hypothetical protein
MGFFAERERPSDQAVRSLFIDILNRSGHLSILAQRGECCNKFAFFKLIE